MLPGGIWPGVSAGPCTHASVDLCGCQPCTCSLLASAKSICMILRLVVCPQADTLGSSATVALCQALAAEVHGRRGDDDTARNGLEQAASAVEGVHPMACSCIVGPSFAAVHECFQRLLSEQASAMEQMRKDVRCQFAEHICSNIQAWTLTAAAVQPLLCGGAQPLPTPAAAAEMATTLQP